MNQNDWSWIGDWTGRRAILTPKHEALVDNHSGKRYSYRVMDERANRLAHYLIELGIQKGDRVGVFSKNRFDFLDLLFACGKTGSILVPFNYRLTRRELEYLVGKTNPKCMFYDPALQSEFLNFRSSIYRGVFYNANSR